MTTFRDNFALGIDVSKYQTKVDWPLIKQGGVSFAFARASCGTEKDPMFAQHVQGAYDADIPMLAYHAVDPGYYVSKVQSLGKMATLDKWLPAESDEQFQALAQSLRNKKIYGIAIDFENFKDWNGNTLTDPWLMEIAKQFVFRVRKHYPGPVIFYTGAWFVWNYAKSIEQVGIREDGKLVTDLWIAFYPYNPDKVTLDWKQLKDYYPANDLAINGKVTQNPPYLGWDGWTFWQFSGDKFVLPGIWGGNGLSATDLNFFNGPKEKLYRYLKFTPRETPTPPTPKPPEPPEPVDPPADLSRLENALIAAVKAFLEEYGE